ncbi:protein FAR1-RELATED SEQUENCE 5-like [Cornus florida]|uniref:protein FAR1-RELATED SEQUENCE 5-like n=1 Tax=Cornus florida TaxID=4283 RepID=UPI00289DD86E|nr:protein FAR1-RELATED SEQUENCE 5-like [Cornus florida]
MNEVEEFGITQKDGTFIPQVTYERKPKEGQQFKSLDDAYDFYNKYAREAGFSVRIDKSKKHKETGETIWKQYVCYKEGETDETYRRTKKKEKQMVETIGDSGKKLERQRGNVREGCKARLSVGRRDGNYTIRQFIESHNHPLATPRKIHLLRSHRNVSNVKKQLAQQFASVNVPTCQQFDILETQVGGIENVGCTERDLRNYERDMREKFKGHDANMLNEYFLSKQEKDPNFVFQIDKDEDDRMTRCFWVDFSARRAYNFFNDVVVFDTTYNTNRYGMIFAPLTGVNHHGKTIIFGCAFLNDETTESFIWLFKTWLNAMPKGPPKVIITDQDPAMTKAIAQFLPDTFHRYCIWHISKKFVEKLDSVVFRDYYDLFKSSLWNSDTIEEFEESWNHALEKSKQQNNEWLRTMYTLRHKWVPAFTNKFFSAGMTSSQRAESSHALFKRYCCKDNSLMDFIIGFNRAVGHLRHEEVIDDHADINEQPNLKSMVPMEKQMMGMFTKEYFHKFQKELYASNAYVLNIILDDESQCVYEVNRVLYGDLKVRQLVHDKLIDNVKCNCQRFEFEGIPCKHILAFFRIKQVVFLPEQYIKNRWTKFARVGSITGKDGLEIKDAQDKSVLVRRTKVSQLASAVIDEAAFSEEGTELLINTLDTFHEQLKAMNASKIGGKNASSLEKQYDIHLQQTFNDPLQVRAKGCGKRLRSWRETKKTNRRRCRGCGELGQSHDKRNCPTLINK